MIRTPLTELLLDQRGIGLEDQQRAKTPLDRIGTTKRKQGITDPGTPLWEEARQRGFRHCFENPEDIGGRYSALSYFGLVPAALLGVDIAALLDHAEVEMRHARAREPKPDDVTLTLGVAMGELGRAGRDKVTADRNVGVRGQR